MSETANRAAEPSRQTLSDRLPDDAARSRRSLRPLAQLAGYPLRYPKLVAGAVVALLVAAATTLALPTAVRRMIDLGFTRMDGEMIGNYFAMLVAVAGLLAAASACRYFFVITLGERVVADIRRDVFAHVTALSPGFFDVNQSGEIVSRLTADTTQIKSAMGATASLALRNSLLAIGAVVLMVYTSPKLSALVLLVIPLILVPLILFGRSVRRKSRAAQDTLADATAFATEQIGAIRTLQAFGNERFVHGRFAEAIERAFRAARASVLARAALTFVAIFVIFSAIVGVLWFGARDVLAGTMSPGTLSQFLLYAVFAAGAFGTLSEVWGELSQAAGAAERLGELLAEEPAIAAPAKPRSFPDSAAGGAGSIVFDHVDFSYPSRPDLPALHDLSFEVRPGETVALVGPSGSGKSTIFSLLLRFYDPISGTIRFDGVDLRQADPNELRHRLAYVPQEPTIFAMSAAANIGFGRPEASDRDIMAAASAASADGFIEALPERYDTELGERGVTLSGGQRQRIAIARAVLRDAPVLLLDEATSALDAESEAAVQQALERMSEGRTTLVIAHRLATILNADRILVLQDGRLVEEGDHRTLVARGGVYSRLAALQFEAGGEAFRGAAE